jgi:hypothetical protein
MVPDDDAYETEDAMLPFPIESAIKWRRTLGRKLRAAIVAQTGVSGEMADTVVTLMEADGFTLDEAVYFARAQGGAARVDPLPEEDT